MSGLSDGSNHDHHDRECLCDSLPSEPVRSEAHEALDEARSGVRLARRSMLAGLGLAAGVPLLAACTSKSDAPLPESAPRRQLPTTPALQPRRRTPRRRRPAP